MNTQNSKPENDQSDHSRRNERSMRNNQTPQQSITQSRQRGARQHPLIFTVAEPIHPVHGPPKLRAQWHESMLRNRIHIFAIFPPFECFQKLDVQRLDVYQASDTETNLLGNQQCVLLCFIKTILGNRYVRSQGFIVSEPRETHPRSEIADVPTSPCPPLDNLGCPDPHPAP